LVAGGFLQSDIDSHGGLKLPEAARPVLKGLAEVWLRRDVEIESRKVSKAGRSASAKAAYDGLADDPLWLALKAKRLELAREQAVPPYVIFHDTTLIEILNRRPNSLLEMSQIVGVGRVLLDCF
jgi:ATP-dependent DNA helicase RecQ